MVTRDASGAAYSCQFAPHGELLLVHLRHCDIGGPLVSFSLTPRRRQRRAIRSVLEVAFMSSAPVADQIDAEEPVDDLDETL